MPHHILCPKWCDLLGGVKKSLDQIKMDMYAREISHIRDYNFLLLPPNKIQDIEIANNLFQNLELVNYNDHNFL